MNGHNNVFRAYVQCYDFCLRVCILYVHAQNSYIIYLHYSKKGC